MDFIDVTVGLIVLIILEIVLGIDNLVILSILSERLPPNQRKKARRLGLMLAWIMRLILLALVVDLMKLTNPLLTVSNMTFSARDFILIAGGAFLIWKATEEIHQDVTEELVSKDEKNTEAIKATFYGVIFQIVLMDVIFSLDSVLTAVGLTSHFWVMAVAISCAILIMIFASEVVSAFIRKHPTIKILALSFLILVGMVLVADGFSFHIPRGYIYFAMAFSLGVESLNLLKHARKKRKHCSGN